MEDWEDLAPKAGGRHPECGTPGRKLAEDALGVDEKKKVLIYEKLALPIGHGGKKFDPRKGRLG